MLMMTTHLPRNMNAYRSAGVLYGDWGTSKTYVIGLAFALFGYASFWPLLAVSFLSLIVGLSYMIICKYYPNGGGVYASVYRRSAVLAIIGAFFLVADFLVTAALSAVAAFGYFGFSEPAWYAAGFTLLIGLLNYLGPRNTANFAFIIAIAAVSVFTCLALTSLPFLGKGIQNLNPLTGNALTFWSQFCSVVVALSGIEVIANTTSIMKLNPGSTETKPIVTRTSTPAIFYVMTEVCLYTVLFGLAATAIPNFQVVNHTVSAPDYPNVENHMLSYLALVFGTNLMGASIGHIFSYVLGIIVGLILLSAVNTALNGLISLQYLMASDEELPLFFRKVNRYGVPVIPLVIASIIPVILILVFKNIVLLADLYAIGFVGAIATNLGATSTDFRLPLRIHERIFMFCVFLVMGAIEITLFIQKPDARYFVIMIMATGLCLWGLTKLMKKKAVLEKPIGEELNKGATLCAVKRFGKALQKAIEESNNQKTPLNLVFIRELKVLSEKDLKRTSSTDSIAKRVFQFAKKNGDPHLVRCYYSVTDSFADITSAYAVGYGAKEVIIDAPSSRFLTFVRGNDVEKLREHLPRGISLKVF